MKHLILFTLLLAAALPGLAADKKDIRFVTLSGTRLLAKPTAFSGTLRRLAVGTQVSVVKSQGAYLFVSLGSGQPGWIASRAVQNSRPRIGSSSRASSDASSEEVAAATKGFNSQVEANYSKDNPALNFKQLDRLEARTLFADPVAGLEEFRKTGKLGEYSGGANE